MTETQLLVLEEEIYALINNKFKEKQVSPLIKKIIMDAVNSRLSQDAFTLMLENEYIRNIEYQNRQQQQESKEEEENDNSDSNS